MAHDTRLEQFIAGLAMDFCGSALHQLSAQLRTVAARLRTDAAVFMHTGVLFTLLTAAFAYTLACLQEQWQHGVGRAARPEEGCSRCVTNIGTLLVELDAVDKHLDMLLGQASICANRTDAATFDDCFNRTAKLLYWESGLLGMRLNHFRYTTLHHTLVHG